jgi:hypothetical protein
MRKAGIRPLWILFCSAACSDMVIEPSQSPVGAKKLPSANALLQETLYIARWRSMDGGDSLTYEMLPSDMLTITHKFSDYKSAKVVVKGRETFRVPPKDAARIRKLLWRLRPEKLEGIDQQQRPVGCTRLDVHDWGEAGITFAANSNAAGGKHKAIGNFILPTVGSCNTSAAVKARQVMSLAFSLLPASNVASSFERTG